MDRKYILLIDMDGVICDWYGRVLSTYRERYPDRPYLKPEEVTQFYVEDLYPEEHRPDVVAITREVGFYRDLVPLPGALEALKDLEENCKGFIDPFICSSPEVEYTGLMCHSEKAGWVEKNLGPWWTKRLILTKDKTVVRGHVLIDDKPQINGVMQPTWGHLVFDQPYNQDVVGNGHFSWKDWSKLKALLKGLADEQNARMKLHLDYPVEIKKPDAVCMIQSGC